MLGAYKGATVFGARADMFNNSFIARLMFFFRILPMVRQRDGLRNVLKNVETQDIIVATLENDVRFCMFPEGRHRPEKSLLPLGKGIFRAALAANAKFGDNKPVYRRNNGRGLCFGPRVLAVLRSIRRKRISGSCGEHGLLCDAGVHADIYRTQQGHSRLGPAHLPG